MNRSYPHKGDSRAALKLREQCNLLWPQRSKANDGTIGDERHRSLKSDHNPNSQGIVTAIDITHDPRNGCDAEKLAEAIRASKDPRVKYLIWNRRIMSGEGQSQPAWVWRSYHGGNPHTKHIHVSIRGYKKYWDDTSPWDLKPNHDDHTYPPIVNRVTVSRGDRGNVVEHVQHLLGITEDGVFGPKTRKAVKALQKLHGLSADGVVGPYTWDVLEAKNDPRTGE